MRPLDRNLAIITERLSEAKRLDLNKEDLSNLLLSHPNYPSFAALSDSFNSLGIKNMSIRARIDQLLTLPLPAVGHFKTNSFFLLTEINEDYAQYYTPTTGLVKLEIEKFKENWSHVLFVLNDLSYKASYFKVVNSISKKKTEVSIALLFAMFIFVSLNAPTVVIAGLLILKGAGLLLSGLQYLKEQGFKFAIVDKLCSSGVKFDCEAVTNSKLNTLMKNVSLSEIGVLYFLLTPLMVEAALVNRHIDELLHLFVISSIVGVFISIGSVAYQGMIVKRWCPICLGISACLVLESTLILFTVKISNFKDVFRLTDFTFLTSILIIIISVLCVWFLLKRTIEVVAREKQMRLELLTLKRNPVITDLIFNSKLSQRFDKGGLKIAITSQKETPKIISVISPFCEACSKAHLVLSTIQQSSPIALNPGVIFSGSGNSGSLKGSDVSSYLLSLSEDIVQFEKALEFWFQKRDFKLLTHKYPLPKKPLDGALLFKAHEAWCKENQIQSTPTIIFFEYKLPNIYNVEDLSSLISNFH